jgi:hypothetical protein
MNRKIQFHLPFYIGTRLRLDFLKVYFKCLNFRDLGIEAGADQASGRRKELLVITAILNPIFLFWFQLTAPFDLYSEAPIAESKIAPFRNMDNEFRSGYAHLPLPDQ